MGIKDIISKLPNDIKDKTDIDEKLEKIEKTSSFKEKQNLLTEVKDELNKLISKLEEKDSSKIELSKLKEVKKQIEEIITSLNKLKSNINSSNLSYKVVDVTKNLESNGLFGKDDKGFIGFFRTVIKFLENLFGGTASSYDKIATTFAKFGYGSQKEIKKVLKKISSISFKQIDNELKELSSNDSGGFIDKVLEKIGLKDSFSKSEKKIAIEILRTIKLNEKFFKNQVSNSGLSGFIGISFIKKQLDKQDNIDDIELDKLTIGDLLGKMFPHGASDFLRVYALPATGVKLLEFNKGNNLEVESTEKIKIGNYEIIRKDNEILVSNGKKTYKFKKITKFGFTLTPEDIIGLSFDNNKLVINTDSFFIGKKEFAKDRVIELLDYVFSHNGSYNGAEFTLLEKS